MTDAGFLKIAALAADAPVTGAPMADLRDGGLDAIRVDHVLSPQECAQVVSALATNGAGFETTEFPGPFRSFFYGRNLNLNEPELGGYFDAARAFDAALARLAQLAGVDPVARVAACLAAMDGGRPYLPAPGPQGRRHFFTTFRGHHPGGYIPAHFDNEQTLRPSYRHVAEVTRGDTLSFVLTLAEAEAGGMLEMFDLTAADGVVNDDRSARPDLASLRSQCLPVPAGSMLVVRSGARLHRVTPVEGARMRWTMCSFMAAARDSAATYCWG
ncbi:MAG: hypothetical protein RIR62_1019 [Pseudomonadota bacterium]